MDMLRERCGRLLYDSGLFGLLSRYGEPHPVGSYVMNVMEARDLDIDVINDGMSDAKLYELTSLLLGIYHPSWYEAKHEITADGKEVWFHGFEAVFEGEKWNVDIWFFDRDTINAAESFCDNIKRTLDASPPLREAVKTVKRELIGRGLYSFDKYTSMDVYDAVLKHGAATADDVISLKEARVQA
ncbi:MAG: hypothetical protein WCQ72_08080 [Eubacteriales bacterium]